MSDAKEKKATAAETADPSKIDKKTLNAKADDLNFVAQRKGGAIFLACGAKSKNKKAGDRCHMIAGMGTDHVGHGRCKFHGGSSTGPKTPEGKAAVALNSVKHGFYSEALGDEEKDIYADLVNKNVIGLEHEIFMLKAKILSYLKKWRAKWEATAAKEGPDQADRATKVLAKESEGNSTVTTYYHAGTIEDKPLIRALETLGRLVDKHAKLNPGSDGDTLVNQLNAELRAASYGQVSVTWGSSKPQTRSDEGGGQNDERS